MESIRQGKTYYLTGRRAEENAALSGDAVNIEVIPNILQYGGLLGISLWPPKVTALKGKHPLGMAECWVMLEKNQDSELVGSPPLVFRGNREACREGWKRPISSPRSPLPSTLRRRRLPRD